MDRAGRLSVHSLSTMRMVGEPHVAPTLRPHLLEEAYSFVCCQKKQESENHHRHQHQAHVG